MLDSPKTQAGWTETPTHSISVHSTIYKGPEQVPRRTQEQAVRPAGAEGGALWGLQWKGGGEIPPEAASSYF